VQQQVIQRPVVVAAKAPKVVVQRRPVVAKVVA